MNVYVELNVPHEWKQQVVSKNEIEDITKNREREGSFINMYERETFRYTIIKPDGKRVRERVYTADCVILKAEKSPTVSYVKKVRVYKNPKDKILFGNNDDVGNGFYEVAIL